MSTRRDFMKLIAAGALGLSRTALAAEAISRKGGPNMKVACAAYSYRKYLTAEEEPMTLEEFLDTAAELGCDGVEITSYYFPVPLRVDYINRLKRRAFVLGLDICSMSIRNNFCMPPGPGRDKEVLSVKEWIGWASDLGAPCVRVFAGEVPKGAKNEDAIRWVAECVDSCADVAAEKGVVLALENHGELTSSVENTLAIVRSVRSEWFGLNLDTGNFRSEDPYRDIERAAPYAVTTHVKVTVGHSSGRKPADYKKIATILKRAGYRGYMVLEYEAAEDPKIVVPGIIKSMKEAAS